jgi:hypothetical protein
LGNHSTFGLLLLASLATGGLMVNWVGLARAMARISSASAYTEFHQATNHTFDPYMPIVVIGAILGGPRSDLSRHSFCGWSAGSCRSSLLCRRHTITLPTNLRINNLIARWSIEAPENWTTVRARWIRFHILRTLISIPALASYVLSVLLSKG